MFTGIIEDLGTVKKIVPEGSNIHLHINSKLTPELKIDQSVAHNGVCLTVVSIDLETEEYVVTAIDETLVRSNIGQLRIGDKVNLERSLVYNGRIDGHIVQGHVDLKGSITDVEELDGSWKYTIEYDANSGHVTVEKGSACINGVSLTVVDSTPGSFSVAIIPFTHEHTTFHTLVPGSSVNLEFDILGKYVATYLDKIKVNY
ncbi:riboflavin synthase [bacterium SCSIO 12741]|nr:riboflavin synthase [bacterium SCSIO 12741]